MTESFRCPSCHAPLDYKEGESAVRCQYCGNTAIVPEALRPRPPEPQPHTLPTPIVVYPATRRSGCGLVFVIILVPLLIMGGTLWTVWRANSGNGFVSELASFATAVPFIPTFEAIPTASPTPSVAEELLSFGGEGTGIGRLDDAREIGLDATGNVYVADYSSGRIQRFDSEGTYQAQWSVVNELNPVTDITVGRDGTVFVQQGFEIHRYEGATGTHLDTISYESDNTLILEDVAPLPNGGLVINEGGSRLVWLDAAGAVVRTAEVPERDRGSQFHRLEVDGQGNVFVTGLLGERGSLEEGVFRYDSGGEYLSFFGGSGDEEGQLRAVEAIAVDSQGRVFVSDFRGVHIFDARGRYLNTIEVEGVPFGIAFDAEDHLWVTNREQVFELEVGEVE